MSSKFLTLDLDYHSCLGRFYSSSFQPRCDDSFSSNEFCGDVLEDEVQLFQNIFVK